MGNVEYIATACAITRERSVPAQPRAAERPLEHASAQANLRAGHTVPLRFGPLAARTEGWGRSVSVAPTPAARRRTVPSA